MNQAAQDTQPAARELTIDELFKAWENLPDNAVIVDIRSPEDYGTAHVPGSRNIPFADVADHAGELQGYGKVYFYCYKGMGSKTSCQKLADEGLDNLCYVGNGGMADWIAAGYPVSNQ